MSLIRSASNFLPLDYTPSPHSVLLGKGKMTEATGNRRLAVIASLHRTAYIAVVDNKSKKTQVVTSIVKIIRASCPPGEAFVKYQDGRWYEMDQKAARVKVGCVLRDSLASHYSSSTKARVDTRRIRRLNGSSSSPKAQPTTVTAPNQMIEFERPSSNFVQSDEEQQSSSIISSSGFPTTTLSDQARPSFAERHAPKRVSSDSSTSSLSTSASIATKMTEEDNHTIVDCTAIPKSFHAVNLTDSSIDALFRKSINCIDVSAFQLFDGEQFEI